MLVKDDWIYDLYVKEFIKPKLLPTDFYYDKFGNMVMTEEYHKRRGSCCGSGCLHCPFIPKHQKRSTRIKNTNN